jgi:hypothetical protein
MPLNMNYSNNVVGPKFSHEYGNMALSIHRAPTGLPEGEDCPVCGLDHFNSKSPHRKLSGPGWELQYNGGFGLFNSGPTYVQIPPPYKAVATPKVITEGTWAWACEKVLEGYVMQRTRENSEKCIDDAPFTMMLSEGVLLDGNGDDFNIARSDITSTTWRIVR